MTHHHRPRLDRILALAIGVLLVAGFLWSQKVRPRTIRPADAAGAPAAVAVLPVESVEIPVLAEAVGTVRSRRQTEIASRVLAEIREIRRGPGDRVEPGEVLIVLDARDLRARVDQARALRKAREEALAEARTESERTKNLFAKQAATQQEVDLARFRLNAAEAEEAASAKALEEAEVQLGHATIAAPFAGVIYEKRADPGDLASPGKPLLGLYDPSELRLEALVDERVLWTLKLKDPMEVGIDALGRSIPGTVSEIVPAVDPSTRTGTVKIDLPGEAGVRPGMFGRARVPLGRRPAIVVPAAAVVRRGQLEIVFQVDDGGKAWMRLVRTGETVPGPGGPRKEILGGLEGASTGSIRVVAAGAAGLREGDRIETPASAGEARR